ncbi:MAG: 30S ribosomal protein S8 [Alphaproteobacteria bacterium]|jgi:small subunit ribosomal protein S8|nr:30S ribosomal protein S8 [Alphaproteobacteria bacterium]
MDIIGDMLSRIRNGFLAKKSEVDVIYSKENLGILNVLKNEGYIGDFNEIELRKGIKVINVKLKYYKDESVIKELKRVSKPSRRIYKSVADMPLIYNGLGLSVVSTSQGILSSHEAKDRNVGGEIICSVF